MIKVEDITEELLEKIEVELGMGSCAWDMIDPKHIIATVINVWNKYKGEVN